MITWDKAVQDYDQKKSGNSQSTSGRITWDQAVEDRKKYSTKDKYKAAGTMRIQEREQKQNQIAFRKTYDGMSVSDWMKRYNNVVNTISQMEKKRNGGYTSDASYGMGADIEDLLSEYAKIRGFAKESGIENFRQYRDVLRNLQRSISEVNTYFGQFGGEDGYNKFVSDQKAADAMRTVDLSSLESEIAQMERSLSDNKSVSDQYQSIYDASQSGIRRFFTSQEGLEGIRQKGTDALEDEIRKKRDYLNQARNVQWMEKYRGKGYGELQGILGSVNPSDSETQWLRSYAETTMRPEDYQNRIQKNTAELEYLENALQEVMDSSNQLYNDIESSARSSEYRDLTQRYGTAKEIRERIEELKKANWNDQKALEYGFLGGNPDYGEMSSAQGEQRTSGIGIGWGTNWLGQGDPVYDYINNIDGARETHPAQKGKTPYSVYDYMTDKEIGDYNYLYNTRGKDAANDYLEYLRYDLNQRNIDNVREKNAEFAEKHPVLASAASVPANLVSGAGAVGVLGQNVARTLAGEYKPIDYNRESMAPTAVATSIRSTVAKDIADSTGVIQISEDEHPILSRILNGKNWGDVYQLGMSMVDSTAVAGLAFAGIPGGTALLGGSAASQGILDALEAGATDSQAITMGILNGVFEALFEEVSLDKLLNGDSESIVKAVLQQGFIEGSEEFCTTVANTIADTLVMGDKSEFQRNMAEYMGQNLDKQQAALSAFEDMAIGMGWDFVGGMLSGGIMAGGKAGIDYLSNNAGSGVSSSEPVVERMEAPSSTTVESEQPSIESVQVPQSDRESAKESPKKKTGILKNESMYDVSEYDGKTMLNSEDGSTIETNIVGVASNQDGKLMLNVSGIQEPVNARQISFANAGEAMTYYAISNMEITPAAADRLVTLVRSMGDTTGEVATGLQMMYTLGENGVPLNKAMYSQYASSLTPEMRRLGYTMGRDVYNAQVQRAEERKAELSASQRANAVTSGVKVNGVQYDGLQVKTGADGGVEIEGVTLNDQQRTGIQVAELLGKMGYNIHVFRSQTGVDGKPIGENGRYRSNDGSIHIDLNAGSNGEGVMAYTIAHEVTHHAKEHSPKSYQRFCDALFEELDIDVAAAIKDKANKLKKLHPDIYGKVSEKSLMDSARDEVVAECCETMLTDTDAAQRIAQRIQQQDKGLWDSIVQWFKDFAQKLRDAYSGLKPDSKIAMEAKKTIQKVDGLVQMWADMVVDAGENYIEDGNFASTSNHSGVKYNSRENENAAKRFANEISNWNKDGMNAEMQFILGSTGTVLQGLGAIESDIYMNGDKISTILQEHPEITLEEIKQIPKILNDPILMLKSRNTGRGRAQNTRMIMFGSVKAQNGKPVMAIFDLRPVENHFVVNDMQKITSAYTKTTDAVTFVKSSFIMYADKKRTASLLRTIGFHTPIELLQSGFIGSISYKNQNVNLFGAKFSDVFSTQDIVYSDRDTDSKYMELASDPEGNELELQDMVMEAAERNGFSYRRNTRRKYEPQNNVLHQMFAKGLDNYQTEGYGSYSYFATGEGAIRSEDILPKLRELAEEFYGEPVDDSELNPPDIIMSAGIWDDVEFVQYMWDNYFEDIFYETGEVPAILTEDGLIVYDRDDKRVKSAAPVEYDDEGNIIPLSKRFDTGNSDIRYSDRDIGTANYSDVKQENRNLEVVDPSYSDIMYSERVIDKETIDFLNNQNTITTYKTMQIVDGKLYPPMAARTNGAYEDYSELGSWEQATEHPELIKSGNKFKLDKGKGNGSIEAAYNPYMHSSNLVLNDQFTGAYMRDNLVTVECEVPVSEVTSGYHAQYAKDSVGWHAWHTGTVAGALRKARGIERQVFLSRWIKPVRIVPDSEVALMYKNLLDGTDIAVPDNVVTPSLLKELKKAGVNIKESGRVKYSDRTETTMSKQNDRLRADVENLRQLLKLQGTVTGGKRFTEKSLKTATNFILRETGRNLDSDGKAEFSKLLEKAYGVLSDQNVTYEDILSSCTEVAHWLDENGETTDSLDEYAETILGEMKGTRVSLDETQIAEAKSAFGSLTEFRKRIAGTFVLSKEGIPLDDAWNILSIDYPMYFDAEASSAGLPGLLVEAVDRLRATKNNDPYQHMGVEEMMENVYDGFWKARKLITLADKYQGKIDTLNRNHEKAMAKVKADLEEKKTAIKNQAETYKQELKKVREEMNKAAEEDLAAVTKKYQDQRNASVENRRRTEIRQKIFSMSEKFHKMATAPAKANTAHAPVGLMHSVARFCEIFADSEARAIEYAGYRLSAKEAEIEFWNEINGQTKTRMKAADAINRQRERLMKKQQAVSDMQRMYAKIKDDSSQCIFYSEHVEGLLRDLADQLSDRDIYDMDVKQLSQVYDTMKAMMYTITNANKVFSMGKDKELFGVVRKMAGEIDSSKVNQSAIAIAFRRYNMYQMSPDTFFSFLCGFQKDNEGKAVQKMFSDGTERAQGVQRDFYQMFRDITETKDKKKAKHIQQMLKNPMNEMIDWGLKDSDGNAVKTSRDMMLQAYMLLCQQDSFESIVYGGLKLPNANRYYNGNIDSAYGDAKESALLSEGIQVDYKQIVSEIKNRQEQISSGALDEKTVMQLESEIDGLRNDAMELVQGATARTIALRDAIEKKLTDYDRECIETARKWYRYSGQLMTDVYLSMYGYKPKLVEDYVPIHRDLSTVKVDIREDQVGKAFNLENSGFTKERLKSRAPILLTGFFTELVGQQQRIARYYGFTQVQNDFNRIWNMSVPGSSYTIKGKVAAKYGKGESTFGVSGEQYVENYIQSVSGVKRDGGIFAKFYGNAASATLSLNPRVAVSQLASIPTAASVVGWKSMAKGFANGVGISISSEKKNRLANDSVWFWQRYRGVGGITEIADLKSSGGLWAKASSSKVGKKLFNWCQNMDVFATASMWAMAEDYIQSSGMKTTDEGYKLAVESCYADIIRKSQPNYTVTERSDLLRDQRAGAKILTMYKTQSNQNFNILVNAIGEFRAASLANSRKITEQTKADLKKAKRNLANAATSVTIGGTLTFVLLRTLVNFAWAKVKPYKDDETDEVTAEALIGGFTKEVFSSIAGMFSLGGELYDILESIMCRDKYYGISDSAIGLLAAIPDKFVSLVNKAQDEDQDVVWKDVSDTLSAFLSAFGVPYNNAAQFVKAAKQWYTDITGGTAFQYAGGTTTKQYRARILKYWRAGDTEKVNSAIAALAAKSEKDSDEAVQKDVTHGFANDYLKDLVLKGKVTPEEAKSILKDIGHDDPDGVTGKWAFQMEYPDSDLSDSGIRAWKEHSDIPVEVFEDVWSYNSSAKSDIGADGKPINGSKKDKVVAYIHKQNLTRSQKDALYLAFGWSENTLNETPWH